MLGAAIATCISDIPFDGPCATTQMGMIDGEFIVNPTQAQWKKVSDLSSDRCFHQREGHHDRGWRKGSSGGHDDRGDLQGTRSKPGDHQIHRHHRGRVRQAEAFATRAVQFRKSCLQRFSELVPPEEMEEAVFTDEKQTREENIRAITERLEEAFADNEEWLAVLGEAVYQYQKKTVRKMILKDHKRPDGRGINEIRPLAAEIDILPQSTRFRYVHPWTDTDLTMSATLAPLSEAQKIDGLDENETSKRYMHHYNFPSYSVGETKPSSGPGRREIGHGALAERALDAGASD